MKIVSQALQGLFPGFEPFLLGRAASALYVAFAAIRRLHGPGEVIVPATVCPEVPLAVLYAGLTPRFCDVELSTFCMSERTVRDCLSKETRAILVVHLFGKAAEIQKISTLASQERLIVGEDLAQAIGGVHGGKILGRSGDFSVISFNDIKILSGGGGALMVRHPALAAESQKIITSLPDSLPRLKHLEMSVAFRNLTHGLYGLMRSKELTGASTVLGGQAEAFRPLFVHRANFSSEMMASQVNGLKNLAQAKRKRRGFYEAYVQHLDERIQYVRFDDQEMCWRLPLLLDDHDQQLSLIERLRARNFLVSDHYFPASFIFGDASPQNARQIGLRALNLCVDGKEPMENVPPVCHEINAAVGLDG